MSSSLAAVGILEGRRFLALNYSTGIAGNILDQGCDCRAWLEDLTAVTNPAYR
jgi:hypothetical protein